MEENFKPTFDRRSRRLPGFDYAQPGAYFITIVEQGRACPFGDILAGDIRLNAAGMMVAQVCAVMPQHIPVMAWGIFQIMPNHFHAIIELRSVGATLSNNFVGATLSEALFEPWLPCPKGARRADTEVCPYR